MAGKMILQHQGLQWDVPSPSFWHLAPRYTGEATIDVSYLGGRWILFHADGSGNVSTRCFESRDEALGMVVQAFKNVGAL